MNNATANATYDQVTELGAHWSGALADAIYAFVALTITAVFAKVAQMLRRHYKVPFLF